MKITIVGAGFSGLTLAYFLSRKGAQVEILEQHVHAGGLIHTHETPTGLVETAANGLYNSVLVEEVFADLGVRFAGRKPARNKRYIFRRKPRRWPLSILETLRLMLSFAWHFLLGNHRPKEDETVAAWATRVGSEKFSDYLLSPALQGIYAGDTERMSARAVLGRFFAKKELHARPKLNGTVAPENGMGELIRALEARLKKQGVKIKYSTSLPSNFSTGGPLVLATSAWDAAEILRTHNWAPNIAGDLAKVEPLPLVSATLFFLDDPLLMRGFGCLFPEDEEFNSLGVLFNSDIFEKRASGRAETWILGGALSPHIAAQPQEEILWKIAADRKRLFGSETAPHRTVVQVWPKALPHYTVEWHRIINRLRLPEGLYLTGNYLGHLGLARILQYNKDLADKIYASD